jgi:hypothetical protein
MIVGIHFRKCLLKSRTVSDFPDLGRVGNAGMKPLRTA